VVLEELPAGHCPGSENGCVRKTVFPVRLAFESLSTIQMHQWCISAVLFFY
jgi:hypothetical protein